MDAHIIQSSVVEAEWAGKFTILKSCGRVSNHTFSNQDLALKKNIFIKNPTYLSLVGVMEHNSLTLQTGFHRHWPANRATS